MPITITGPHLLACEAQDLMQQINSSKHWTTQYVCDISLHIVSFVKSHFPAFVEAADGELSSFRLTVLSAKLLFLSPVTETSSG